MPPGIIVIVGGHKPIEPETNMMSPACRVKCPYLKELRHPSCILQKISQTFQNRHFQSALIFSILSHPCSFLI